MSEIVKGIETIGMRTDLPLFRAGDTVKVHVKVKEGDKERIQVFQGVVIARKHGGIRETITVRKIRVEVSEIENIAVLGAAALYLDAVPGAAR